MSGKRVVYERDEELEGLMGDIVRRTGMDYVDLTRIRVMRSYNSRSRALARIWQLPRAIGEGFGIPPVYVIEVVWEKFSRLGEEERTKVLIHELLHIPQNFSGNLRSHGDKINERVVRSLYSMYKESLKRTG